MRNQQPQPVQVLDIPFPETADIERQVLADLVTAPDAMGDAFPLLHPDFFTSPDRRGIWETIAERYNGGAAFDLATLTSMIGRPFIDEVLPKTVDPASIFSTMEHVTVLRNGAAKRRAYAAAATFLQQAVSPAASELAIVAGVERFTAQVECPAPVQNELTLAEAIQGVRRDMEATRQAEAVGRSFRIPTGLRLDDAVNGGFKPGQLIVLAARPGVGKTSLMLHLAKNAARNGFPVYISTLEMTGAELGGKFLLSTGRVRPADVAHGNADPAEFDAAAAELSGLPVFINQFSRTLDEIVSRITQAVKRGACRIAFIDYLGLVQDTNNLGGGAKLYQIIARITSTLKALAKRLSIPVVLLCQLNREQVREKRPPELNDLRDSGSIEQDADIVLMLENEYKEDTLRVIAWLRKNRSGRRVGAKGGDLGFVLIPNETYSAFADGGVRGEEDLPAASSPAPVGRYNPNAFTESAKDDDEEDNYLPF